MTGTETPMWNDERDCRTENWENETETDRREREQRERSENWEQRTRGRES